MSISYFKTDRDYNLAYRQVKATGVGGNLPTVLFLGGFKSDMEGTKALYLEEQCRKRGQGFVRFDYFGHGKSDGMFHDGMIGLWKRDALDVLDHLIQGDVFLIGSSMGGWISLLLLLERADRVQKFVGIAAAPDFTREIKAELSAEQYEEMMTHGLVEIPNEYSDAPYIFTRALIEDGEENCVLDKIHQISVPMTLLQGKLDTSVPWKKALRIRDCFQGPKTDVVFIDDGDHRLSRTQDLALIDQNL